MTLAAKNPLPLASRWSMAPLHVPLQAQPLAPVADNPNFWTLKERDAEMDTPLRKDHDAPLRGVRANIVQSIRAHRVQDLQEAAAVLGQHFLYANLAHALTKQDVLDLIAQQFLFPAHFGKNFDALADCLTDPLHKCGPQPGFVVVLEQVPATAKFDKEAREQLLDVFRDAAEYWGERKIAFRCFYSFL